jgi:hypothetical protein
VARAPGGRCWYSEGGGCEFCMNTDILNEIWTQNKICILEGTLLGCNMHLALVSAGTGSEL